MKKTTSFLILAAMSTTVIAKPYLGLQAGVAGIGDNDHVFGNFKIHGSESDQRATGRISAGYLADIPNSRFKIGVESGLQSSLPFKSNDYWDVKVKRWSFDILAVADFYATEKLDLFAKLGAAYTSHRISSGYFYSASFNETVPKAGIGIGYDVTPCVNFNLSLNHEFSDNAKVPSLTSALVGIRLNLP
ncbi:MAG: outer membrane beta-barrel protein [Gammaproteobacteria bacterium]